MQPFKEVENYFTDSLLYQENNEPIKQPLPDNVDSGNEADSKSEKDTPTTFSMEPIIAYLYDLNCNILSKMRASGSLMKMLFLITLYVLRMYLNLLKLVSCTCLYLSRKQHACIQRTMKGSSLSLLQKGTNHRLYSVEVKLEPRHPENQTTAWNPYNFFITRGQHRMIKRMGYSLNRGDGLDWVKGGASLCHLLYQKENQPIITTAAAHLSLGHDEHNIKLHNES